MSVLELTSDMIERPKRKPRVVYRQGEGFYARLDFFVGYWPILKLQRHLYGPYETINEAVDSYSIFKGAA